MATHPDQDLYSDDSAPPVATQESEAFSPTDGYFQPSVDGGTPAATDGSSGQRAPSHAVPQIPSVLVEDPTLSDSRSAKETEALRNAQQHPSSPEEPLAGSPAQPNHHAATDTAEGFGVSDSGPDSDAPQTPHRYAPQHPLPTAATRFNQSGSVRPILPIDAPPAYSSAQSRSYGTVAAEAPSLTAAENSPSAGDESEPLLPSHTVSANDTPETGPNESTNKLLPSNKRSKIYLCMIILITAIFSSLVTAGIILLPPAFKVFGTAGWRYCRDQLR